MEAVLLVIHLIVALAIIISVLLQRAEGGGLGIGGGGGGMGNFASPRSAAGALTRLTTWLGTIFFITSITLAILASQSNKGKTGTILDAQIPSAPVVAAPSVPSDTPVREDVPEEVEAE